MVASKINLFLFSSKRELPYESTSFFIMIRHRLKIMANRFYATHKINPLVVKMMAVQKVMRCIFNFQTARMFN